MEEKENYCNHCPSNIRGYCCYRSFRIRDYNIILPSHPCIHLNHKTHRCRIYKKRFRLNKDCADIETAYRKGGLPYNCRYLQDFDYPAEVPPKLLELPSDLTEEEKLKLIAVDSLTEEQLKDLESGKANLIIKLKNGKVKIEV